MNAMKRCAAAQGMGEGRHKVNPSEMAQPIAKLLLSLALPSHTKHEGTHNEESSLSLMIARRRSLAFSAFAYPD